MIITFDSKINKNDTAHNRVSSDSKVAKPATSQVNTHTDLCKVNIPNKSKNGCLTCKIRKKKCDEARPICSDCKRLNKECVWIDYTEMSKTEIKQLKEKVEVEEGLKKLRKRRPKISSRSEAPPYTDSLQLKPSLPPTVIPSISRKPVSPSPDLSSPSLLDPSHLLNYSHSDVRSTTLPKPAAQDLQHDFTIARDPNIHITPQIEELPSPGYPSFLASPSIPLTPLNFTHTQQHDIPEVLPHSSVIPSFPFPDAPPVSPSAFLNFLKDLSQHQHTHTERRISQVEDEDETGTDLLEANPNISSLVPSPSFSSLLESFSLDFSDPALADLIPDLNNLLTPLPTPLPNPYPELPNKSGYLYSYYVEVLSKKVSIAPSSQFEANSYQSVFLPLARKDKGVLYAILGWAGFHLGGDWAKEGSKYIRKALKHLNNSIPSVESGVVTSVDYYNGDLTDTRNNDRQAIIIKLATLLILCGAEICKGDVKNWSIILSWGWKLLYSNGGILEFNKSKEEHWLISNFAYHDLLASSSSERGTYFSSQDYKFIFKDSAGYSRGNLNSLLGVSKTLYRIIGDISTLLFESNKNLKQMYVRRANQAKMKDVDKGHPLDPEFDTGDSAPNEQCEDDSEYDADGSPRESEPSEHGLSNSLLHSIIEKARKLEHEIDNSRPESVDLEYMTDDELELQLTLFEAYQLSAKLFLKQCVMKCNPSMLEMQMLNADLIKCIDILIGSSGQASLVFPMYISGIHCVTEGERKAMSKRMDDLMSMYGTWNVQRAKSLMEKVWDQNCDGTKVVDWHAILRKLGWEMNFG